MAAARWNPESPGLSELKPKYDFSPTKTTEAVKKKRQLQLSTFLLSGMGKLFPDNLTRMEIGKKMRIKSYYLSSQLEGKKTYKDLGIIL